MLLARPSPVIVGIVLLIGVATVRIIGAGPQSTADQRPTVEHSGSYLFGLYCASCHGTSAKGDGPLADSFRKRPPDLTQFSKQNKGVFPSELVGKIIDGRQPVKGHGGPNMPVWGDAFSRAREDADPESVKQKIQAIVDHLATIQERPGDR